MTVAEYAAELKDILHLTEMHVAERVQSIQQIIAEVQEGTWLISAYRDKTEERRQRLKDLSQKLYDEYPEYYI